MEGLTDDQKVQALLAELNERYNAGHKMRERSTQFALWISGMAIALAALVVWKRDLVLSERISLTALTIVLAGGTLYFIAALRRGFDKNREAMVNVERALRMHEAGVYLSEGALLPAEYGKPRRRWSDHFCALLIWLVAVGVSLITLMWVAPGPPTRQTPRPQIQQAEEGNENG